MEQILQQAIAINGTLSEQCIFTEQLLSILSSFLSPKDQIKTIRKGVRAKYKKDPNSKALWQQTMKFINYGKYRKKTKDKTTGEKKTVYTAVGAHAVHHVLDSDGIRNEMPSIIPSHCNLTFKFATYVDGNRYFDIDGINKYQLLKELKISDLFEHSSQMKEYIDDGLHTSDLCVSVGPIEDHFWCKTLSRNKSALDRAMGVEVSDYIMRYRPDILVPHTMIDVVTVWSGTNIGVGFNLDVKSIHSMKGMIHFEEEHIGKYCIEIYAKNGVTIQDIKISLKTDKLEGDELILFDGNHPRQHKDLYCTQCNVYTPDNCNCGYGYYQNGYRASRGPTNNVMSYRYDPMSHGQQSQHQQQRHNHNHPPPQQYYDNMMNQSASNDDSMSVISNQSSVYHSRIYADWMNTSTSTFDSMN